MKETRKTIDSNSPLSASHSPPSFRLLMLSAMYENGGNLTHRLLDGHPQMFVYPFESQLGTRLVNDHLCSMFPVKYRWPLFALEATPLQDYKAIIDEECKVRARTPHVSKFRHISFDFSDDERCELYCRYVNESGRSRLIMLPTFSEPPLMLERLPAHRGGNFLRWLQPDYYH